LDKTNTPYGALVEGKAVCEGYAVAYTYLLHMAKINSVMVVGKQAWVDTNLNHMWNMVLLDDNCWYEVDVASDYSAAGTEYENFFLHKCRGELETLMEIQMPQYLNLEYPYADATKYSSDNMDSWNTTRTNAKPKSYYADCAVAGHYAKYMVTVYYKSNYWEKVYCAVCGGTAKEDCYQYANYGMRYVKGNYDTEDNDVSNADTLTSNNVVDASGGNVSESNEVISSNTDTSAAVIETIENSKVKIKKLTKKKKSVVIKLAKKAEAATGYQVAYSTKKAKSIKKWSLKTTKKNTKKITLKKLKSKKRYYVKVRSYTDVVKDGKTIRVYSKWSKVKRIKTK